MDEKEREREFYRRLQEQGLWISRAENPEPAAPLPFEPVEVRGKPISQQIIEDRR